jgi:xylulokinase
MHAASGRKRITRDAAQNAMKAPQVLRSRRARRSQQSRKKNKGMAVAKRSSCVLGIDLGTSALKLVAVSQDGRVIATAHESYTTISTSAGQAEQHCEHWLKALSVAAKKIRSRLTNRARIEAVALTGQMPTLVVVRGQKAVVPAITWQDSRANAWVSKQVDDHLCHDIYHKTGILIDGRYLAPMFQYHHGAKRRACRILSAKDFLFHCLTGLAVTDPSTASGYGLYNLRSRAWDPELCKFWNVAPEQLPSIESSSFRAPLSNRGSQLLGCTSATPVVLGCADSVAGVYAVGGHERPTNTATVLTGTSTVIVKCDAEPRWDLQRRYLLTPFAVEGLHAREADLLATGSAREWAENICLRPANKKPRSSLWKSAYRIAPGADGLLFAPFLAGGEQGVLWNPSLRGTITGLTLAHNGAQIARALLEGMYFEVRRCLQVFEEEAPLSCVCVTGWVAAIPEELQLLADILGWRVHGFKLPSASAIGVALLTGLIDGKKYSELTKPVVLTPGQRSQRYDEIYASYIAQFPGGTTVPSRHGRQ